MTVVEEISDSEPATPETESDEDTDDFRLISSIRYDPALLVLNDGKNYKSTLSSGPMRSPLLLLPYHQDRLVAAAAAYGWDDAANSWRGPNALIRMASQCEAAVAEAHPTRGSPGDKSAFKARNNPLI